MRSYKLDQKSKLPTIKTIKYNGYPYNELDKLWHMLY